MSAILLIVIFALFAQAGYKNGKGDLEGTRHHSRKEAVTAIVVVVLGLVLTLAGIIGWLVPILATLGYWLGKVAAKGAHWARRLTLRSK